MTAMGEGKRIMIVAGEASGDLHGAALVAAMKEGEDRLSFYGVGGDRMREAGVRLTARASDMAVVGLTEVVSRLGKILGVMRDLRRALREERPDLVILIDYPDFNLPLARAAKKEGIKVFYYISPQVWAWRRGRVEQIKRYVDRMAVILPFEEEFYARHGLNVHFVGHPLLDLVKPRWGAGEAAERLKIPPGAPTVALLPGSRMSEVRRLLPVMVEAADLLRRDFPKIRFLLPLAETIPEGYVQDLIKQRRVEIGVMKNCIYDCLALSDGAVVASGTATLETALMEVPMVIVYKVSPLTYTLGRILIRADCIGLANIIAGKKVVPELIQGEATGSRVADEVRGMLNDEEGRRRIKEELSHIRESLGRPGAAKRAAALALGMI